MKRSVAFVVFFLVFGFALAGLYWSQRRAKSIPVSPNAILNMAADAQRDLSRLPMHLTRLSDEQEVASVLAHEVEHIDHYHCVERVQVEAQLRKLDLDVVAALVEIPLDFWQAGYHKDEEFEGDREGMYLAVQSGYSPYGAADLFERFAKLCDEYVIHAKSPDEELSQLAIQSLSGYFRSHPLPSERLAQANRIIAQVHCESRTAR